MLKVIYVIEFYLTPSGENPVFEYMTRDKNDTDFMNMFNVIERLSRVGQNLIDTDAAKRIGDEIFELRKDHHRIMYAPTIRGFVLLSAFWKQSPRTPPEEIRLAKDRLAEYKHSQRCHRMNKYFIDT